MVQRALRIGHNDHAGTIHDELAKLGGICICEALARLQTGAYDLKPQDDSLATYAKKLEKQEGEIDWNRPVERIHNQIRAMYPWPGAFFDWTNPEGKVLRLHVTPGEESEESTPQIAPGTVLGEMDGKLAITTADRIYLTPEVKPQGKKGMDATAFTCGYMKECK
jgi:methionyl-tRNA formyltransferase